MEYIPLIHRGKGIPRSILRGEEFPRDFMMRRIVSFLLSLAISGWIWISPAESHPHVFMYNQITVVFDQKGLAGFEIRWAFDEMFSSMIIMDFDKNRNGRFETSEIESVEKGAFSNLKGFDYFTHIKINGKPFRVKYVKDFSAEIDQGTLIYRFFVPCHVRATKAWRDVKISVYDREFYTSVFPASSPVALKNQRPFEVRHRIRKNKAEAYYFEQIYPDEVTLGFRLKNG